jgi:hypothetical protein
VGITYRLCPLSRKRLAILEADPELVNELVEGDVPGVLDLGSEGFELDGILLFAARDKAIRDAVFAQTGRAIGDPNDGIRVHTAKRVLQIHQALSALPSDVIARHHEQARRAIGHRLRPGAESIARFTQLFERLRDVYIKAAAEGHGMLTFMV